MLAFIALFFPAAIMVFWKRRLFREVYEWKAMLMEYIAGVVLINFLIIAVTCLLFGSNGNVVNNINTYNSFALKYLLLAVLLAAGMPAAVFFAKKSPLVCNGSFKNDDAPASEKEEGTDGLKLPPPCLSYNTCFGMSVCRDIHI